MTDLLDHPTTTQPHTPRQTRTQHHTPPHNTTGHTIRPLQPDDTDRIRHFFTQLSLDTAYRRYFTGGRPSDHELHRLFNQTTPRHTLLALSGDHVIGLAEATPNQQHPDTLEIGVVVADAWQHNGIGTTLVHTLTRHAAATGAHTIRADTHADNHRMARIMRRLWPQARPQLDGPLHTWCVPIRRPGPQDAS